MIALLDRFIDWLHALDRRYTAWIEEHVKEEDDQ